MHRLALHPVPAAHVPRHDPEALPVVLVRRPPRLAVRNGLEGHADLVGGVVRLPCWHRLGGGYVEEAHALVKRTCRGPARCVRGDGTCLYAEACEEIEEIQFKKTRFKVKKAPRFFNWRDMRHGVYAYLA